jgi:hypothetical protein
MQVSEAELTANCELCKATLSVWRRRLPNLRVRSGPQTKFYLAAGGGWDTNFKGNRRGCVWPPKGPAGLRSRRDLVGVATGGEEASSQMFLHFQG